MTLHHYKVFIYTSLLVYIYANVVLFELDCDYVSANQLSISAVLGQLSVQLMSCCPAHIVLLHDCICAEMQIND